MAKWADYAITHVRYDDDGSRIVEVKRRKDTGNKLVEPEKISRQKVVASIESGSDYCTAYLNDEKEWEKGDDVEIMELDGEKFIRTDGNRKKSDNLGGLSTF